MEKLIIILIATLISESVWETLKMTWQKGKLSLDRIGALITALVVCIGVNIDLLALLGINTSIPFLGTILTGVLVSRGSNFIHDLLEKVTNIKGGVK